MPLPTLTDQEVIAQLDSGSKWSGATITYSFATDISSMYSGGGEGSFSQLNDQAKASARLAMTLWDDLIAPDTEERLAGTSWSSTSLEFGMGGIGVDYAHAYFPGVGSVWFNPAFDSTQGGNNLVTPAIGKHGFVTYIHEIGHALGLEHMGDYNGAGATPQSFQDSTVYSVMSYFGPSWGSGTNAGEGQVAWADWVGSDGQRYSPQTPMLNDVMAIQSMYGVETTTRTGDTIYGFNSNVTGNVASIFNFSTNKNPIITIFDSAGTDTLDLSGWNTASIINIAPGGYTSCNSMTLNIAIAYTCSIENAIGGGGADTINGNSLANSLKGGAGNDQLFGFAGADMLFGGNGNDTIDGGDGLDYAFFENAWANIQFTYNVLTATFTFVTATGGTDTIKNVEYFTDSTGVQRSISDLIGGEPPAPPPGNATSTVSVVASAATIIEGSSGATPFTFVVSLNQANSASQSVAWSLGLTGAAGVASSADFSGATSGVVQFAAGQQSAIVTVYVAGDFTGEANETFTLTLSNPTSGLTLGAATATATIVNDDGLTLNGNSLANTLNGSTFSDVLNGLGGNDTLNGLGGDDWLDGGTGSDTMTGGAGNDTYVVDNSLDRVVEGANEGTDTIRTTLITFTLPTEIEALVYTGTRAFTGSGNGAANTIIGGDAADRLNGGLGADVLWGGLGRDSFDFTTTLGLTNIDTIMDFNAVDDSIRLENAIMTGLGTRTGTLTQAAFNTGSQARDSSDRIIYDSTDGSIYYDADGTGSIAQVKIAVLSNPTGAITASDFLII